MLNGDSYAKEKNMKIDTEHLHFWMQAIRQSENPSRTLDAFWKGQLTSKEWLIDKLLPFTYDVVTIDIVGGWVGVLASMIFQSDIIVSKISSVDIDSSCESIASMMNKGEEIDGKFIAITEDMCTYNSSADIIINTSCEHITQQQYEKWLSLQPINSLLVLQSNNYDIPEHIRLASDLEDFKRQSNINILWAGELELPLYKRFMIIGKQYNV
jgi:hypothetical protein